MFILASAGTIIIAVLVLIVGAIAAFYITRMMKGKIELEMVKTGFNSGEAVTGTVRLTTKKSLEARRVYVALIGYRITERRDSDGDKKTDKDEVYRDEFNLEADQLLPAGFDKTYEFSLIAPGGNTELGGALPGGAMGTAIGAAASVLGALGANRQRMEWKVEARADLPGVDIATSKKVRVNVS